MDYRDAFKTTEDIPAFRNYLKKMGANNNYRMGVVFAGKTTHAAVALKVDALPMEVQQRVVKIVKLFL